MSTETKMKSIHIYISKLSIGKPQFIIYCRIVSIKAVRKYEYMNIRTILLIHNYILVQ